MKGCIKRSTKNTLMKGNWVKTKGINYTSTIALNGLKHPKTHQIEKV